MEEKKQYGGPKDKLIFPIISEQKPGCGCGADTSTDTVSTPPGMDQAFVTRRRYPEGRIRINKPGSLGDDQSPLGRGQNGLCD
jgi:hypothetical protein